MGDERFSAALAQLRRRVAPLAMLPREALAFAYIRRDGRLLGVRHRVSCSRFLIDVPVRAVTFDALSLDAAAVVMAHNHPSGDPRPSADDTAATRRLWTTLDALDVRLLDHLVVASGGLFSFLEAGLL